VIHSEFFKTITQVTFGDLDVSQLQKEAADGSNELLNGISLSSRNGDPQEAKKPPGIRVATIDNYQVCSSVFAPVIQTVKNPFYFREYFSILKIKCSA